MATKTKAKPYRTFRITLSAFYELGSYDNGAELAFRAFQRLQRAVRDGDADFTTKIEEIKGR